MFVLKNVSSYYVVGFFFVLFDERKYNKFVKTKRPSESETNTYSTNDNLGHMGNHGSLTAIAKLNLVEETLQAYNYNGNFI